jgi:hypothetical protein
MLNRLIFPTFLILLCGGVSQANASSTFFYASSPTSWVGDGVTRQYTTPVLLISGHRTFNLGAYTNSVNFNLGNGSLAWSLDLVGPNSSLATAGSYPNAERYPFQPPGKPGLALSGNGRGDNELTGSFNVLEAVFDATGNLQQYAVDFVQYDEKVATKWNYGSLRFNSDIPINVPEPSTFALLAIGAIGGTFWHRKRRGQTSQRRCRTGNVMATRHHINCR